MAVTDGLGGGHDVGRDLAVFDDLSPEGLAADLRLGGVRLGSDGAGDVAEHRGKLVVIPGTEEEGLAHVLFQLVGHAAVRHRLDGGVRTGDTLVAVHVEVVVHVGAEVQKKVFRLHRLVVLSTAAEGVVRSCHRPQEVVDVHVVADGYVQIVVDTRKHLLGVGRIHREVAAVLGPVVGGVKK